MKKHLLEGVKKGAFDEAEATRRFEEWMKQNRTRIEAKKSGLEKRKDDELSKRLSAEKKINEARAAMLAKKQAELAAKEPKLKDSLKKLLPMPLKQKRQPVTPDEGAENSDTKLKKK
jgi:small subunit ribosomal protein S16